MKILLVDDDGGSLRGLAFGLKMLKHSCDAMSDPFAAWEKYQTEAYDVVITDICMPGINGIELGRKMKQLHSDACIIYMSGQLSKNAEEELKNLENRVFLRKPIEFEEMRQVLTTAQALLKQKTA